MTKKKPSTPRKPRRTRRPRRCRVMEVLRFISLNGGWCTVGEICKGTKMWRSNVFLHTATLLRHGWIKTKKQIVLDEFGHKCWRDFYCATPEFALKYLREEEEKEKAEKYANFCDSLCTNRKKRGKKKWKSMRNQ